MPYLSELNMDNLALYLLDLVQNSIEAKADHIDLNMIETSHLCFIISDDGCGMSDENVAKVTSPFYTTRKTRRVGMGLSLIKMLAEQTEGSFSITSKLHQGTELKVCFNYHHIDMPDIGNLGEMVMMIAINPNVNHFNFHYIKDLASYHFDLDQIRDMFGMTLTDHQVMQGFIQYINQEIDIVRGRL